MNRKNTKSLRKVNNKLDFTEKLILVRDGVFNYLQFLPTKADKYTANQTITAKPVVTIKNGATQTVVLDYSGANDANKTVLDLLFSNVLPGNTFLFNNAHYVNPITGEDVELEAVLQFTGVKDWIIRTETSGVTLPQTDNYFYDPEYFIDSPVLTFNTVNDVNVSKNIVNELKNSIPVSKTSNLLKYLGTVPGDYIKIVNSNSVNSDTLFRVVSTSTDTNEYMTLDPAPQYENLIGEPTLVKVFCVSDKPEAVKDIPFSNVWGCANIQDGITMYYFPYVSKLQAEIKKQQFKDPVLTYYENAQCVAETATTTITTTTTALETVTSQEINVSKFDVVVARGKYFPTITQVQNSVIYPVYSSLQNSLTIDVNGTYQFIQSDPSNVGNTLRFSSSSTLKQPLYEINGVTNYVSSNAVGTVITVDPKKYYETTGLTTLYAYSQQNPTLGFTVNLGGELPVAFRTVSTV